MQMRHAGQITGGVHLVRAFHRLLERISAAFRFPATLPVHRGPCVILGYCARLWHGAFNQRDYVIIELGEQHAV
jgi:hypothetical protein